MLPSAALFVDASNFYHSLKVQGRLPFDYSSLFSALSNIYNLKQVYFYDALKDIARDPEGYSKQQKFHAELKRLHPGLKLRTRKLKYIANVTPQQVSATAKRVGIVDSCREKLWSFLQNLGLIRVTKEKGVDVLLVSDAIEQSRTKQFEVVILLSGDADFVPAVHLIKSFGVKVVNLHSYTGSSNELRNACNGHLLIDFDAYGKADIVPPD